MVFNRGFHRGPRGLINSTKNIQETSSILVASTNTRILQVAVGVENATKASPSTVDKGSKIYGLYLSLFFYAESGEVAAEVPLVDWYIYKDPAGNMGTTFDTTHLPTPGATGVHENNRWIMHTEKGLAGGGDASLNGVPMVFKGVIKIPKGMQTIRLGDIIGIAARANFATKFCAQAIYKYYR